MVMEDTSQEFFESLCGRGAGDLWWGSSSPVFFRGLIVSEAFEALKREVKELGVKKKDLVTGPGLSTGSTLLNLACSGRPEVGFPVGKYVLMVGDSDSGKSWCCLSFLAEACRNKFFDDYDLIYDNVEHGNISGCLPYFSCLEDRIELLGEEGQDPSSSSLESFYEYIEDRLKKKSCVYILDSMDSLIPEADEDKMEEERAAREKGKESTGSYGTAKAKLNSSKIRVVSNLLDETKSILVTISQTRDSIGFGAKFNPKTRSGGRALKFYSRLEFWMSVCGKIKKTVKGQDYQIGANLNAKVVKNHFTGWVGDVPLTFYRKFGIDDIGGNIQYLLDVKYWKKDGSKIHAPEFDHNGTLENLVGKIEEGNTEWILRELVATTWNEIEEACVVDRKCRY